MARKGQSITLAISDRNKAELERLALELGMTWGDRANISKLVEAIARRQLTIAPNHDWKIERINALNQARSALVDAGKIEDAVAIAQLLIERSELTIPLRVELEQFIAKPVQPWRLQLERYIRQQQPFQLSYQDAAERVWQFTIRYAVIASHEDRQYLDCWCEETEEAQGLGELQHNRSLRLDRITDAAISRADGQWRSSGLATILVELHLFRGLAFAYRSKSAIDIVNEWHEELPRVRRVVRQVSSTFWLIREILRYGQDCEVVAPESVRELMKQEILGMCDRYGIQS
ncbi:helix-turn-helix transcriptional regulator [Leptolyngbya sp. GGD]|uniref:helix-turn-helix transcriptional regulator n=1 Tax=Leptolyngbya sp. GGD TaxID=2997907 RepID=UPI00227B45FC|nr:WYL domain-containing protein [Leptolyngbya sp. GGD]MCY6494425.1 WYL domain-containing protein [Leptolyngbya sp. GGD]